MKIMCNVSPLIQGPCMDFLLLKCDPHSHILVDDLCFRTVPCSLG